MSNLSNIRIPLDTRVDYSNLALEYAEAVLAERIAFLAWSNETVNPYTYETPASKAHDAAHAEVARLENDMELAAFAIATNLN